MRGSPGAGWSSPIRNVSGLAAASLSFAITLFTVENSVRPGRAAGMSRGTGMPGVSGLLVIWFGTPIPLEVVLADMLLDERPVCVAEPAERAGRGERAGHVVLL